MPFRFVLSSILIDMTPPEVFNFRTESVDPFSTVPVTVMALPLSMVTPPALVELLPEEPSDAAIEVACI